METSTRCPECGTQLPADAPKGLCPRCLLKQALESHSDGTSSPPAGVHSAQTIPAPFDADKTRSSKPLFAQLGDSTLSPGQQFGEYRIQRLLGKGGMGEVYEAFHAPSGRWVAVKILNEALSSEEDRRRFLREGRLAASVSHPHCVYVYGTEEIEGIPTIIMELAPAGTINQLVKRNGPPTVERVVEMGLQLIDGLEAALAAGVLHRDIKPSNCFLDSQGQVKVGDFGLSIATLAKDQSQLTILGSFIGTPVFASPEQLRGDRLDVRSDIYSLGVTLYYMLTGTIPFEANNMVQLVATVLERAPQSPSAMRREIPKALSQVILRCLEKTPEKRFDSYRALRKALQPFSPGVPAPAPLGRRFVAGLIDDLVLTMLVFYPMVAVRMALVGGSFQNLASTAIGESLFLGISAIQWGSMAASLLYYAVLEGIWGASLGKVLTRLRVVNAENRAPGLWPALIRAAVIVLGPMTITQTVAALCHIRLEDYQSYSAATIAMSFLSTGLFALLFSTMRPKNGYAAIHDLISKTRVISKPSFVAEPVLALTQEVTEEPKVLSAVGPYGALQPVAADGSERVIPGYDSVLRRNVWLHLLPNGSAPVTPQRRDVSRQGRLRWINGLRASDACWDAYEAPDGLLFLDLVNGAQPWNSIRRWIIDLAEELSAAAEDGSLPPYLALDRIWITAQGRAKLLDFPTPGSVPSNRDSKSIAAENIDAKTIQQFLLRFATAALRGSAETGPFCLTAELGLPVHAIEFLNRLEHNAFDGTDSVANTLRKTVGMPGMLTWRRRLACATIFLVLPTLWCLGGVVIALLSYIPNIMAMKNRPELFEMMASIELLEFNGSGIDGKADEPKAIEKRKALEIYVASHYKDIIKDPSVRSNLFLGLHEGSQAQKLADQALADYPSPTEQEIQAASITAKPLIVKRLGVREMPSAPKMLLYFMLGFLIMPVTLIALLAPVCAVTAFLTRGGMMLRFAGIAVVSRNGQRVSRLRALWRSLITWSPGWFIFIAFFFIRRMTIYGNDMNIAYVVLGLFTLGSIISISAKRSIQDRLAGSYLVTE